MANVTGSLRVESFPFDSKADGYDADGYPVYDRAVGALTLRTVFKQFFTDGVFGTPADALQISKGDGGLKVNVAPGVFIIRGAMARVGDGDEPVTLTLSDTPPQGNVAYGIMLHYDENDTESIGRSLSLVVVAGEASSSPQPPAPDQSTPGIYEYRLGYVTVPSGATDLSAAVVTNEKGTGTCPYAAPFDEIDLSEIVEDARNQAQEVTDALLVYAQQYYDLVASAIDDTTAGYLMEMINNISAASFVDNVTLSLNEEAKAQIKSRAVKDDLIAIYGVHSEHMDNYLRQLLGILDPSSWNFQQVYDYVEELGTAEAQQQFITENMTSDMISDWTASQIVPFATMLKGSGAASEFVGIIQISSVAWADLATIINGIYEKYPSSLGALVGKTKSATVGSFGSKSFRLVGIKNVGVAGGGQCAATFISTSVFEKYGCYKLHGYPAKYSTSAIHTHLENDVFPTVESGLKSAMKQCTLKVTYASTNSGGQGSETVQARLWLPAGSNLGVAGTQLKRSSFTLSVPNDGGRFEYYSAEPATQSKKYMFDGLPDSATQSSTYLTMRGMTKQNYSICVQNYAGSGQVKVWDRPDLGYYYAPCFCI